MHFSLLSLHKIAELVNDENALTSGMHGCIKLTMDRKNRNPLIRVLPQTRKKLKMIAVYYDETMQEAVERIAEHELKWIEQKGRQDDKSIQIPPLSE